MKIAVKMISKCNTPLNIQFELTYGCNNKCAFCYNCRSYQPLPAIDTTTAKTILEKIYNANIFSVNFNGGEPLFRPDFFELTKYAKNLGLDLHINTNANLVGDTEAKYISKFFESICTSILSLNEGVHDLLSGRNGAFQDTIKGIENLQKHGVYVATNIMLCKKNADDIIQTLQFLENYSIKTILITRLIPSDENFEELHISDEQFFNVISEIKNYQENYQAFARISFPQPIPPCNSPNSLSCIVAKWNIPCTIGLCTARISPYGLMTPCTLVEEPILGDLKQDDLYMTWKKFEGETFFKNYHLKSQCLECNYLIQCGGGCKGYNDAIQKQ